MKKSILAIVMFGMTILGSKAQSDCIIPMMVLVPQQVDELAPMAQAKLESKIRQIITLNGMEGSTLFSNFCIVANLIENSKEVTSGLRPLVTIATDLELFIGNNYTGEKFASTVITLTGAGHNESKAYGAAFSHISIGNHQIQNFLKEAKLKIYQYYDSQTPAIITQARKFALQRDYEEALCLLSAVPTCSNNYTDIEKCMFDIYQQYIDYDCATKVNKARSIWNAGQDSKSAAIAGAYLASIDPTSSCWEDALALAESIRMRIGDDWEFSKELMRDSVILEKSKIEAIRAIGVAFGQNQKAQTIRENWFIR